MTIKRALISVSDKNSIIEIAEFLSQRGVELISTGGTARVLREGGLDVTDISKVTNFPEIMDGRVKTLHPLVHGGLLARDDVPHHVDSMNEHGIERIDLVIVNLYPFAETVAKGDLRDEIIENIDIGGPSMVRSAAKNHQFVTIISDPADYEELRQIMEENGGGTTVQFRRKCAARAFAMTAQYDAMIAGWFAHADQGEEFPESMNITMKRGTVLRYGENPHQKAAIYEASSSHVRGVGQSQLIQGKPLSYNNLNDADAAFELISEFAKEGPTAAIIKHANPSGVAQANSLDEAYKRAFACDSVSAFGGIVALNRPIDGATAEAITSIFTEVVLAPDADEDARAIFAKKKNLRLLLTDGLLDANRPGLTAKSIAGGWLVQSRDGTPFDRDKVEVVTKRKPTPQEWEDCLFAWAVAKHVKSNAIVYARDGQTAGIGAGQMNRLESSKIAAWKAVDAAQRAGWNTPQTVGSAVASDAFFPFADGLLAAVEAGATAVIQPGGSRRDDEVIAAADDAGIAMLFTGQRHFRH